jgi:hypothetical protein
LLLSESFPLFSFFSHYLSPLRFFGDVLYGLDLIEPVPVDMPNEAAVAMMLMMRAGLGAAANVVCLLRHVP